MKIRRFVEYVDGEDGPGLKILGYPDEWYRRTVPNTGIGFAHDLLEHPARPTACTEEELAAVGAAYWIREEGGWMAQYLRSPTSTIRHHYRGFLWDTWREAVTYSQNFHEPLPDILPDPRVRLSKGMPHVLEEFEGIVHVWLSEHDDVSFCQDKIPPCPWAVTPEGRARILGWMWKGYQGVRNRFRGMDPSELAYTFQQISESAGIWTRRECVGQRCLVTVGVRAGTVDYRLLSEREWGRFN